jgi:hypothetical protein
MMRKQDSQISLANEFKRSQAKLKKNNYYSQSLTDINNNNSNNNSNNNNNHNNNSSRPNNQQTHSSHHRNNSHNNHNSSNNSNHNNSNGSSYRSKIEAAILNSNEPIDINESAEICANGYKGIWANKDEIANWVGPVPLSEYPINQDPNPILIKKKSNKQFELQKKVLVRYLEPPRPRTPGEIIVKQEGFKHFIF